MFLTLTGEEAYNALKDLVDSVLPSTKTYNDLMEVLSNHYCPKKLVVTESYKSYGAQQDPSEDVKSFAAKLKNMELAEGQARAVGPEVDAVNKLGNGTFGNLSKQLREKQTPKRSNFSSEEKLEMLSLSQEGPH
ncbi:hypothetical protein ILUMI_18099 [Ignelater luminosus]|uniref:Uncharacterized protein n=1 Tax=Ignelater luminosus TaxID=2038154 RepID=A0A8K0G6Q4_IGNLU|nr:hypothetical protein ILUMI_18099 [Ignelater luminosus]